MTTEEISNPSPTDTLQQSEPSRSKQSQINLRVQSKSNETFPPSKKVFLSQAKVAKVVKEEQAIRSNIEHLQKKLQIEKRLKDGAHNLLLQFNQPQNNQAAIKRIYCELLQIHKREIDVLRKFCSYTLRLDELLVLQKDHNATVAHKQHISQSQKFQEVDTLMTNVYKLKSKYYLQSCELEKQKQISGPLIEENVNLKKFQASQDLKIQSLEANINLLGYQNALLSSYQRYPEESFPVPPPRFNISSDVSSITTGSGSSVTVTASSETIKKLQSQVAELQLQYQKQLNFQQLSEQKLAEIFDLFEIAPDLDLLLNKIKTLQHENLTYTQVQLEVENQLKQQVIERERLLNQVHELEVDSKAFADANLKLQHEYDQQCHKVSAVESQLHEAYFEVQDLKATLQLASAQLEDRQNQAENYDYLRAQSNRLMLLLEYEKDARASEQAYASKQFSELKLKMSEQERMIQVLRSQVTKQK